MLHGMGVHISSFQGIARFLLPTHNLVLVDYSGFSQPAGWPSGGESIRRLTHGAISVAMALRDAGIAEKFSFVGSSLGGGMCLLAALEAPHMVDRIVLFNPAAYPQRLPLFYRQVRAPLLGELIMTLLPGGELAAGAGAVGYADPARFDLRLKQQYRANMKAVRSRWRLMDLIRNLPANARETSPHMARAREITQSVLIIWGEQDRLLARGVERRLADDLPQARLITFPQLSHLPHEEAPETVGPVVAEFLNSQ